MTKVKELVNFVIFMLVLGAVFILYTTVKPHASSSAPVFVYEEIQAQRAATRVAMGSRSIAMPVPMSPIAAPLPIAPPRIVSEVLPEYPVSALENGIEGMALVQAYVGLNGRPEQVQVRTSSGNAELDSAAVNAVSLWIFSPAAQGNTAVASWFTVPVRFNLK